MAGHAARGTRRRHRAHARLDGGARRRDRRRDLREMGRPIAYSPNEIRRGFAERATHMAAIAEACLADLEQPADRWLPSVHPTRTRGVVLVLAPWNYPYLSVGERHRARIARRQRGRTEDVVADADRCPPLRRGVSRRGIARRCVPVRRGIARRHGSPHRRHAGRLCSVHRFGTRRARSRARCC